MINIADPVYFYDDRNQYDWMYKLTTVLYSDDDICLCVAQCTDRDVADEKILFDLNNGEVINSEFYSWIATSDNDLIEDLLEELSYNS